MRLSAFLHCTELKKPRFISLRRRDQLPFVIDVGYGESIDGNPSRQWTEYKIIDAFALRVMLDFADHNYEGHSAIPVETACMVTWNAMREARGTLIDAGMDPRDPKNWVEMFLTRRASDVYLAWTARPYEDHGETRHGGDFHCGTLLELAQKLSNDVGDQISRIVYVNLSRAIARVVSRCLDFPGEAPDEVDKPQNGRASND